VHKLKPSRRVSGAYGNKKLDEVFKGKDRLIYDIVLSGKSVGEGNVIYDKVREVLKGVGYYLKDFEGYINNEAYRVRGGVVDEKNPTSVGKVLTKKGEVDLLKSFINDPIRNEEKSKRRRGSEYKVVVSRHPYDLYGMSTDRSWSSCMRFSQKGGEYGRDVDHGVNKHYVYNDILFGTLVAYLVSGKEVNEKSGKVALRRPLSRILMKPFVNRKKDVVYGVGRVYGNVYQEFKDFVGKWVTEKMNFGIVGDEGFHLERGLYDDGDRLIGFKVTSGVAETVKEVIDNEYLIEDKDKRYFEVEMGNGGNNYDFASIKFSMDAEVVSKYDWGSVMTYSSRYIDIEDEDDLPMGIRRIFSRMHNFSLGIDIEGGVVDIKENTKGWHDEARNGKYWDNDQEYDYVCAHVKSLKLLKYIEAYGYEKFRGLIIENIGMIYEEMKHKHDIYLKSVEESKSAAAKYFEENFVKSKGIEKVFGPLYDKIRNKDLSMYFGINEVLLKEYKSTNDLELYKSNVKELIFSKWDVSDIEHIGDFMERFRGMMNTGLANIFDTKSIDDMRKMFFEFVNNKYDMDIRGVFNNSADIFAPIIVLRRLPSEEKDLRDNLDNIREVLQIKRYI
jgi:hypothetical protein